jgi:Glycosyltransferases, probably involved in cell wall biogenesis
MTAPELPLVSLVVPCRNEERHIGACLDSLLESGYPLDRLEILVVDGSSDDGTRALVAAAARKHSSVRLLENPRRITPAALNIGLAQAHGSVIMLIGAHSTYPGGYIRSLVDQLDASGADGVGGTCTTCPGADTAVATAIAVALAHPFGVGNSWFRIGTREPRWVDTVPFGCYRREVFDRIGGFDEDLVRNQDDEFNLRLLRRGGRLLLVPAVASRYYARASLGQLARMYYQYGLYKPLVIRKVGAVMTVRQVVPAAFVAALGGSLLVGALIPQARFLAAAIALLYTAVAAVAALAAVPRHGTRAAMALLAVFPVLHVSYGAGFLVGALRLIGLSHRRAPATHAVPLSR